MTPWVSPKVDWVTVPSAMRRPGFSDFLMIHSSVACGAASGRLGLEGPGLESIRLEFGECLRARKGTYRGLGFDPTLIVLPIQVKRFT